jgi:hypothetical protein
MASKDRNSLNVWGLVGLTYGLVIITMAVAVGSYFYYKSNEASTDQSEPDPTRRILVGGVWVPVYLSASYFAPTSIEQGAITNGGIKFKTSDPAGEVLAFYEKSLKQTGYFTTITGTAGGSVQGVRSGGKMSVLVSVSSSGTDTQGEIHTLFHDTDKEKLRLK